MRARTAGPSNIGDLTAEGIPATAGFGLPYQGLHGVDGLVHLADLPRRTPTTGGPSSIC